MVVRAGRVRDPTQRSRIQRSHGRRPGSAGRCRRRSPPRNGPPAGPRPAGSVTRPGRPAPPAAAIDRRSDGPLIDLSPPTASASGTILSPGDEHWMPTVCRAHRSSDTATSPWAGRIPAITSTGSSVSPQPTTENTDGRRFTRGTSNWGTTSDGAEPDPSIRATKAVMRLQRHGLIAGQELEVDAAPPARSPPRPRRSAERWHRASAQEGPRRTRRGSSRPHCGPFPALARLRRSRWAIPSA